MNSQRRTSCVVSCLQAQEQTPLTDDDQLLFTMGFHTEFELLILGETGVGKTHLARLIHDGSARYGGPFVVADCGAMTESLFESELFGHRKGAFTGAVQANEGLVSLAHGGTLFLDEIGNLPSTCQAKLLRLIEAKAYRSLGEGRERRANVRIIAATNADLATKTGGGRMRDDLYYRLTTVSPIRVRPLRERRGAIRELAEAFVRERCAAVGLQATLTDDAVAWAAGQGWPGNVRQLKGAIGVAFELARVRWASQATGALRVLQVQDLARAVGPRRRPMAELTAVVGNGVAGAEFATGGPGPDRASGGGEPRPALGLPAHRAWVVGLLHRADQNQSRAAVFAGVSRRTLVNWIELHGLPRPRVGEAAADDDEQSEPVPSRIENRRPGRASS